MSKFSAKISEISPLQYNELISIHKTNGNVMSEQVFGSKKTLWVNGKISAIIGETNSLDFGGLDPKYFTSFLGQFNKQLFSQFQKSPTLFNLDIKPISSSVRAKNMDAWSNIPIGTFYCSIDFKSAYWQFAHKLGYLNTQMFNRYMPDDNYKVAKRFCISFLGRQNKKIYYNPEGFETHTIECDMSQLAKVYENIRTSMNNLIAEALDYNKNWIEYTADSISVLYENEEKIKDIFRAHGIVFKTTLCRKFSHNQYMHGCKEKVFHTRMEIISDPVPVVVDTTPKVTIQEPTMEPPLSPEMLRKIKAWNNRPYKKR